MLGNNLRSNEGLILNFEIEGYIHSHWFLVNVIESLGSMVESDVVFLANENRGLGSEGTTGL